MKKDDEVDCYNCGLYYAHFACASPSIPIVLQILRPGYRKWICAHCR